MTHEPTALPTAPVCDALARLGLPLRTLPANLVAVTDATAVAGRARPVRHAGSVDLLFEAIDASDPGEILVIDNEGRIDEACIGDLVVLEAKLAGLAAVVVWGLHRDELVLREIGLPVFSYGRSAVGPSVMRARPEKALLSARLGEITVTTNDVVVVDVDGGVVVELEHWAAVSDAAAQIVATEKRQSAAMREGRSLREQLDFATYLERSRTDPDYDFRTHLRSVGGAIEA